MIMQSTHYDRGECRCLLDLASSGHVDVELQDFHDLLSLPGPGHVALTSPLAKVLQDEMTLCLGHVTQCRVLTALYSSYLVS